MSKILDNLLYTDDHEWLEVLDNNIIKMGITDHAQSELGDIVFVELPEVGDIFEQGDSIGTIEAVKTVADIFSPVSGEIIEVNDLLEDDSECINNHPYSNGWIATIRLTNASELDNLYDAKAYKSLIGDN